MRAALVALLLIAAVPRLADAECAPRDEKLCLLVNSPGPIIQGTILKGTNSGGYAWVVRVDRSFRGNLKGQIVVWVTYGDGSGPASFLKPGEQYLFYLQPNMPDGSPGFSATLGCGSSVALQHAEQGEVAFLARLESGVADGHIFGELSRASSPQPGIPYSGVRVTASRGTRRYSTHTRADGTFDVGGLPPGSYHLDADVRDTELVETEEDPIELQPHGCAENDLDVQDNTVVRGRITVPAGMRNRLRFVSAFTVDGTSAKKGGVLDEHGRYEIHGLPPGDYVFGTSAGEMLPRPDAPFVQTYAPGTADLAQARRIHLTMGMTARDVNISMGPALPIKHVSVRLVPGPIMTPRAELLVQGGRIGLALTPQADGTFTIPIVARGDAHFAILAMNGCSPPTPAADGTPTSLELELSADGCRQIDNLSRAQSLARGRPGRFLSLPVHATLSDGRPAAGATIFLSSSGARTFSEAFHADRDGRLDLSVPGDDLFTIRISWRGACPSATWLVNTSGPIRMTPDVRGAPVDWSTIAPIGGPLEAVLSGPGCR